MVVDRKVHVETALRRVTARLTRRFGEQLEATVIEETVRRCAEEFDRASVVEFVPVFVERRSVEQLNALVTHGDPPVPSRPLEEARDEQAAPPESEPGSPDERPSDAPARDDIDPETDAVAS